MSDDHMTPDAFRRHGHEMVEWIARYMEDVERYPVRSRAEPGDIFHALPAEPPETGEPFEDMMRDVERILMPGITHWQSPSFFAYFPANSSGPGILGELLSAGLGVQGMSWLTSPACTELEMRVLDWCVHLLDLPRAFLTHGVIQDSASSATLCAILAAREQALLEHASSEKNAPGRGPIGGGPIGSGPIAGGGPTGHGTTGAARDKLVAYASTESHSSVMKGMRVAGFSDHQLRTIAVDRQFAMRADDLASQMERDRAAGLIPFFVCATVGTTSSNAMDPLVAIGDAVRGPTAEPPAGPTAERSRTPVWLHVDAAMSGTAAVCPEFRAMHRGLEHADSYCFNPHKWMFTNFDCDCFFVRDRDALVRALAIEPEYLKTAATDVVNYRDWQIPLGRRFRSLKLWFVLRHYGSQGLQRRIREHVALAQEFAGWVDASDRWEILAPHPLNLVCFAHRDGNDRTRAILENVNAGGGLFASHTVLAGRYAIRLCVGQTHTTRRHVEAAWAAFQDADRVVGAE